MLLPWTWGSQSFCPEYNFGKRAQSQHRKHPTQEKKEKLVQIYNRVEVIAKTEIADYINHSPKRNHIPILKTSDISKLLAGHVSFFHSKGVTTH